MFLVLKHFLLEGPSPCGSINISSRGRNTFIYLFIWLPESHRSVTHPDEMILTWLCSRTSGESGPRRCAGTHGFSHFPKSTRNRERQAMSDGIRPERENSGGQWFLNHRRGWTRSASSPVPQSRRRRTNRSRVGGDGATLKSLGCLSGAGRWFGRWLTAVLWSYLLFLRNAGSHRMMCNVYFHASLVK